MKKEKEKEGGRKKEEEERRRKGEEEQLTFDECLFHANHLAHIFLTNPPLTLSDSYYYLHCLDEDTEGQRRLQIAPELRFEPGVYDSKDTLSSPPDSRDSRRERGHV